MINQLFLPVWCGVVDIILINDIKFFSADFKYNVNVKFICDALGVHYNSVLFNLYLLEKKGLVYHVKKGGSKFYYLTNKGRDVGNYLNKIKQSMGGDVIGFKK